MIALGLTMRDAPESVNMVFQREYGEPYNWIVQQLKDLAFTFCSSFLYYLDYDSLDETTRNLYRQGIAAFGGIAPTYHIELQDKPMIVWEFHSLLRCLQMMFSFMLVDEENPLQMCKNCTKIFIASDSDTEFCSVQCENEYKNQTTK